MRKCSTPYCKNKPRKGHKKCETCRDRVKRKKRPMYYCYKNLKNNSKRRGIKFTLTFEDFKTFCIETDYMRGRGQKSKSYTIDRIESEKGYVPGNLQVLTNKQNTVKQSLDYYYDGKLMHWYTSKRKVFKEVTTPF